MRSTPRSMFAFLLFLLLALLPLTSAVKIRVEYYFDDACKHYHISLYPPTDGSCFTDESYRLYTEGAVVADCGDGLRLEHRTCYCEFYLSPYCKGPRVGKFARPISEREESCALPIVKHGGFTSMRCFHIFGGTDEDYL